jgi:hypothetical protein
MSSVATIVAETERLDGGVASILAIHRRVGRWAAPEFAAGRKPSRARSSSPITSSSEVWAKLQYSWPTAKKNAGV